MTRQEERKKAAQQRYDGESRYQIAKAQAFLVGARWADKTMIEKACEWLSDNMRRYAAYDFELVEDLRKAMEK